MTVKETVGANLKKLREQHNILQKEMAIYLGVAQATVARYETAVAEPNLEILVRYADFFKVSLDSIFGREIPAKGAEAKQAVALDYSDFNELKKAILDFIENYYRGKK